jgi:uridine kinase
MDPSAADSPPTIGRFAALAIQILAAAPSCGPVRLVAIDGAGGAGKTTFAGRLAAAFGAVSGKAPAVVHTDDFATADNQFGWSGRLLAQLIAPLREGRPGRYQRYDWETRQLAEWHRVRVAPVVLIEGVGAARREFIDVLSRSIWVQTPAELRLARGLERDGADMLAFWTQWIAGENAHFAIDRARERADLIIDGNPHVRHDPDTEFVVLASRG